VRVAGVDLWKERYLVAEVGNNHEGDLVHALELVDAAAESGADAVKFQAIRPERLVHREQRARVEQLQRFALSREQFAALAERAAARGIAFMASAFDFDSLDEMAGLCSALKVASGDLDFLPLVERAAASGLPLFVSTGTGTLYEVDAAVGAVEAALPADRSLADSLAILHCVSAYPAPPEQCNLRAIETLERVFPEVVIGWSDHTLGITTAIAAAALGARAIEKHFTLDKKRSTFRDHALSADPQELRLLADALHALDRSLGSGEKQPAECELDSRRAVRRSIVAARDLPAGEWLKLDDLDFVRPAGGLPPSALDRVLGNRLAVARSRHDPILEEHLS
jgi:sialic acid synthase SpsE